MSSQGLIEKVMEYSQRHHLLEQGDKVIAGISGGPDSVCLFLVLQELRKEIEFEIEVVHVNHCLRGAQAESDEDFVRQLCERWRLPCHVFREDVNRLAQEEKLSMEEAGREVRRRCFEKVLSRRGGTKIALAHHMDDNAETLIMNLCRGSGVRGLGGMRPQNHRTIRPLLCLRRGEIEGFLHEAGQTWCEDESNAQDHYTRNRIRNHVLPYLVNEVNSGVVEHMNTTMEQMRELEEYLTEQTETAYSKWVVDGLLRNQVRTEVPKVIRNRLIFKCMSRISGQEKDISAVHVEQVDALFMNQSGKQLFLPHGIRVLREYDGIRFVRKMNDLPSNEKEVECKESVLLRIPGETTWLGNRFTFRCKVTEGSNTIFKEDCENKNKGCPYTEWFNYDIIKKHAVTIRSRQAGDQIVIDRQGHRKKLKALLVDAKVPANRRNQIPVLALEDEILWVPGVRRSNAYLITEATRQILQIECTEDK